MAKINTVEKYFGAFGLGTKGNVLPNSLHPFN